ncbi:hypothetical protein GUITHDRAFT_85757 [Guillardia theta CCMP2712]|uniref:Nicotinamide-nucleotide adenylyltransferase n=1 Tax=Guillardia theta (strain CCMP2712) TaxID=905079 RepID=L1JMB6_GUITC|nr:hypothetical protein GUITHDRAFT_85757 [Guillardia theta CCMP2712]EKX49379.1 hypothetical protein GUITHDRAFT_85757 [Guillardia theta CCMP2712]|eukprot:XP_005836359.1 hypothetical protein GUITHDRAFT_85757 [Guillardia theta CCMP2712]
MSASQPLPFDPTSGSLSQKKPFDVDVSKLQDPSKVQEGCNPVVLLACGSFSPPTVLHTRIFETARDYFRETAETNKLQVVGGFISPVHPSYGKKGLAAPEHRVEMVKRALETSDWIACDEWEVKQNEWTRTRLSLDRMYQELNKDRGGQEVKVMLLCGADILESMVTPGKWRERSEERRGMILSRGIVCIKRSGSDPERLIQENDLLYERTRPFNSLIVCQAREWVENNVSSTAVRRAIKRNMSVKYFVADPVLDYIKDKRLFLD